MAKRTVLCVLLALSVAALASAQGRDGGRGMGRQPVVVAEKATVTGNLTIVQGSIAVKSGDTTYMVPGLGRYVGFIDGLKDGAQVRLEGNAITNPQDPKVKALQVTKLTIGGKEYDLARPAPTAPGGSWVPFGGRW